MSRSGIRVARSPVQLRRPIELALLSGTGVVWSGADRAGDGVDCVQGVAWDPACGADCRNNVRNSPFTIVWFYWGLWDVMQSAWWSHVLGGPLAIVGLRAAFAWRNGIIGVLARGLPAAVHPLVATSFAWCTLGLLVLEVATVAYLLTVWKAFGIGVSKPLRERHR